jgi:hypothetical protein
VCSASGAERELLITPPDPDAIIAALAARQHGVVSLEQLLVAGLSKAAVRRRVRTGRLHRMHRGVYAVGHPGLSFEGRCMAAVLAAGPQSAASHVTAAELCRVNRWPTGPISVVTETQRRPNRIDVHRARRLDPRDVTRVKGVPCTTIPRLLVDLADSRTPHQLAWVMHEAAYWRLLNLEEVRRCMQRNPGRRLKTLQRAIELHLSGSAGTRSAAEDAYLASLPEHERDTAIVNTKLEVDVRWGERIVEIDGGHHAWPASRREDARRDARLRAAGFEVTRLPVRPPQDG